MKLVSLRLEEGLIEKIDEVARKTLQSRSEIIRSSIALYLSLLENIGFYFKPSLPMKNVDVYEERNAVNVDLGNLTSVSVLSVSYGGVGELELDFRRDLGFVAEVMANQVAVETHCRFITPLLVMLTSTCEFLYTHTFFRMFSEAIRERMKVRTMLAGYEEFFETKQSGFVATVVGLRDMSTRNSPRRGDRIYFFGNAVSGAELSEEELLDMADVERLVGLVKEGKASAIFPVKSGGLKEVADYAAALAGGKAMLFEKRGGCPATAIVLTSAEDLSGYGCELVGEIL
ncbi:ribbon-helix-helix domain-containing protein [Archaeoglobus fulgidus]|uniref:ribbon-helix-helix domain-containing protein n=1 Tax=Archaeoglobus fulgidus TaxID=2234 RepID=UPI000B354A4F|nr:ribbon-helix-helix domain-containing protein [Archaeoglobus fulgidus]